MIHRRHSQRGFSLILVLGSLVLLSTLVVAFLTGMTSELKASKLYADGSSVRMLSQSTVNIVMAEIQEATLYTGGKTWASQPGMIRTYDNTGAPGAYYKLYSAAKLKDTAVPFDPTAPANAVPANWASQKAFYIDLNEPVTTTPPGATATLSSYPILDGNNLTATTGGALTYMTGGVPDIDGFSISNSAPVSATNKAPMPVSWLYVLSDGQVIAPTGTGATATVNGASKTNPIVGRIAFWTDDETCKININTASEGTYWDAPKVANDTEKKLGKLQPSQHEYQRYPGHPAMTCLSTVFKTLSAEQIYPITPRITGGPNSSLEGTQTGTGVLSNRLDRLYSSIDELLFQQPAVSDGKRSQNNAAVITKAALEKAKFFVTACSRAPDVNLFGKPRVGIWPLYVNENDTSYTSAFDRLIAFCGKIGGFDYFFRRQDATSPTNDLPSNASTTGLGRNRMLLTYLSNLTSQQTPGFGGKLEDTYGATNRNQILTECFDYIRSINLHDPTVAKAFDVRMGTSGDAEGAGQVVPIYDSSNQTRGFGRLPTVSGAFILFIAQPIADPVEQKARPGQIQLQAIFFANLFDPSMGYIKATPYYGLRVSGLQDLQWSGVDSAGNPSPVRSPMGFPAAPNAPNNVNAVPSSWGAQNILGLGGALDFRWFSVGQSSINSSVLSPAKPYTDTIYSNNPPALGYALVSSTLSSNVIYVNNPDDDHNAAKKNDPDFFRFYFYGAPITVEIVAPDKATGKVGQIVQTVTLPLSGDILCSAPSLVDPKAITPNTNNYQVFHGGRLNIDGGKYPFMGPNDTVISVVPQNGDVRLAMVRKTISPAQAGLFYDKHAKCKNTGVTITTDGSGTTVTTTSSAKLAHNLRNEFGMAHYGSTYGRFLALSYYNAKIDNASSTYSPLLYSYKDIINGAVAIDSPIVPSNIDILGDWDNCIGRFPDGPYINKADDGDICITGSEIPYFNYWTTAVGVTLFTPNRMMPSAVMFGSLPTEAWSTTPVPWQTLLFCPNPLKGSTHPGFGDPASRKPPDYLYLDLFNMPVVEPYAISEPLSTAGRINMNCQIIPFTYINRDTGLRAVLKSEKLIAINIDDSEKYKNTNSEAFSTPNIRLDLDLDETVKGFWNRFATKDIFRSAAEICSIFLVPKGVGATYGGMATWWDKYKLTGDNSRERPYATIYPRLTTQSNTYTVYMRVQSLRKAKTLNVAYDQWVEGTDVVTGEYRGSQTIERYVDPTDSRLVDFAATGAPTLDKFYKFRVVSAKQFAP